MKQLLMISLVVILNSCGHQQVTPKIIHKYSDRDVTVHLKKYDEANFLVAKDEEMKLLTAYANALRDNMFLNKELDILTQRD